MEAPSELTLDLITSAEAGTLPGLFLRPCERTPQGEAYRQYDPATAQWKSYVWRDMHALAARWRRAGWPRWRAKILRRANGSPYS